MAGSSPYSRTRNRQLRRVLKLLTLIVERRRSIIELSGELAVTTRTVRRDLQAIEYAGLPIYDVHGSDGVKRWTLEVYGGKSLTSIVSRSVPTGDIV